MSEHATPASRTSGDLVAMTPYLMGFAPRDCLILHGIDIEGDLAVSVHFPLAEAVAGPRVLLPDLTTALKQAASKGAILLAYGPPQQARDVVKAALTQVDDAGLGITDVVAVRGFWYRSIAEQDAEAHLYSWREVPVASPAVAALIADGAKAPAPDRATLAQLLAPAGALAQGAVSTAILRNQSADDALAQRRRDLELIERWERSDRLPDPEGIADLALAVCDRDTRNHVVAEAARTPAESRQDLWIWVLRHVPESLAANVGLVAAVYCYLQGDGILAKEILASVLAEHPDHGGSRLLWNSIMAAIPPAKIAEVLAGLAVTSLDGEAGE